MRKEFNRRGRRESAEAAERRELRDLGLAPGTASATRLADGRDDGLVGLVDGTRHQFVLGTHYLMHSTFVRLMYLDGRYSRYFEKFLA